MKKILALVLLVVSGFAFGADAVAPVVAVAAPALPVIPGFFDMIQHYAPHMIAFFIGLQIMLRGIAEGLTKISVFTDNQWDNKAAAMLSNAAWIIGSMLGKFGYSVPSEVQADKIDTAINAITPNAVVKTDGK